jgi:hypothetical protein
VGVDKFAIAFGFEKFWLTAFIGAHMLGMDPTDFRSDTRSPRLLSLLPVLFVGQFHAPILLLSLSKANHPVHLMYHEVQQIQYMLMTKMAHSIARYVKICILSLGSLNNSNEPVALVLCAR